MSIAGSGGDIGRQGEPQIDNFAIHGPRPWIDPISKGADPDGLIDSGVAFEQAASALPSTGGVLRLAPGTYITTKKFTLRNRMTIAAPGGATLKWVGTLGGTMFDSPVAAPLMRARVLGLQIDPGANAGFVFDLHSPQFCEFDCEILDGSTTLTAMRMAADATNSTGYDGTRNAVFNIVRRLSAGQCGTLLRLKGQATGVVTLNHFEFLQALGAISRGIVMDAQGFVDSNTFGLSRFNIGANGIGLDLGENNASTNIYNNAWLMLAVDVAGGVTGVTGINLRNSDKTLIYAYYHTAFAGGTALDTAVSDSWYIRDTFDDGGPTIRDFVSLVRLDGGPLDVIPGLNTTFSFQKQGAHGAAEWAALDTLGQLFMDWRVAGGDADFDIRFLRGTGANGGYTISNRGTGLYTVNLNGSDHFQLSPTTADTETALLIRRNVGGALTLQRVSMGAVDSGGSGFKVLRVPN